MQCLPQSSRCQDQLLPLHAKLSLAPHPHDDYDILFAQGEQGSFNQLFSNSFHHNHNFSEIDEHDCEEDSLFNPKEECFNQAVTPEHPSPDSFFFNAPTKQSIQRQDSAEYDFDPNEARNKILEILRMKDKQNKMAANKSKDSHRDSVSHMKNSSKSLVLKPKVSTQRSQEGQMRSALKLRKADKGSNITSRIKTEANQQAESFSCHANQVCRTDYDELANQRASFCMIAEEKDSLQCTFKPTLLKQCLLSINNEPHQPRKSEGKNAVKLQNKSAQSHSLKSKNVEQQSRPCDAQKGRVVLSKKSSVHASGSTLDVAARNQLWLMQREQRLTQKRKQQEEEKLKQQQDFSFKPSINLYRKDQKAPKINSEKEPLPPPFFERLSMAKRKSTGIKFKRDEGAPITKNGEYEAKEKNKQNLLSVVNYEKDSTQALKSKKQRYEAAVKELHHKIMKMNL